ncbi:MAG: hypothetical protein LBM70_08200 [Victivallales bacterium]|jgi:FMN phosphatase YigB (HAD superfamily)|nr:hypothetical protein [Victivallales bacterium]
MKLASFDIFDTVLIRKCGKPENIFYLLATRLYPHDRALQEEFMLWRRNAVGTGEKIADIYAYADFPGYSATELIEAEKAIESENLVANPAVRQEIEKCRNAGYVIAFISDMYLPGVFLSDILNRENCLKSGEKVFVSCEYRARKDTGELYKLVRNELHPGKWIHYGDHPHSDIKMARKKHIKPKRVKTDYTFIEQKILSFADLQHSPSPLSLLAGFSRVARIAEGNSPEAVFSADFVIPSYLPYVQFALDRAKAKNAKRLYFLSRDGFILRKAAEALQPELEMRDLFVSRRSLTLPYLADDFSAEAYLKIMDKHTLLRKQVSLLLQRLCLNREELKIKHAVEFNYETISTSCEEQDFLTKLFDGPFAEILKQRAIAARSLALEYFHQSGLTNGETPLLIDIGWLGSTRLMLNSILRHAGHKEAEFLYFGVRRDVFPCRFGKYESYYREGCLSTTSTVLVEHYFSTSPFPTTLGYKSDNGKIIPEWEEGSEIRFTPLIELHVRMIAAVAQMLDNYAFSQETLYLWSKLSIDAITGLEGNPDLHPLAQCDKFDAQSFVRRLTFTELLKYACGKNVTAFDPASVQITVGDSGRKFLTLLHCFAVKHIYPIYRKLR